uniref:Putative ecdysteroid kinase n=1 Tax=Culex tarsalis TaxID=7177 RepID=A0A1Q3FRB2_CULTA
MATKPSDLGLDSPDLELIVRRYLGKSVAHFTIQHAAVEQFGGSPEGFLAEYYALKIRLNVNGSRSEELSLFVKSFPTSGCALANFVIETKCFRKETDLYEKIIPKIQECVPGEHFIPRHMLTKEDRLLVMENVKLQGYDILKNVGGLLDYDHLKRAFEALAHMHAGSVLLEERESKGLLELFPGALKENSWTGEAGTLRTNDIENAIVFWCEVIRAVEKNPVKLSKICAGLPGVMRRLYEYVKPSVVWRNVFSQGDLWNNNVMFKHGLGGEPVGCILVDFQLARYTPPGYDINMLLSLTSTNAFRSAHMNSLLDHYYEVFAGHLTQNGIDPSKIYTKQSFLECCQYYRLGGQLHGCVIAPEVLLAKSYLDEIFLMSEDGFMTPSKVKICLKAFQSDSEYRERMLDCVQELVSIVT